MTAPFPQRRRDALLLAVAFATLLLAGRLAGAALAGLLPDGLDPRALTALGQAVTLLLPALLALGPARALAALAPPRDVVGPLAVLAAAPIAWLAGIAVQLAALLVLQAMAWPGLAAAQEAARAMYGPLLACDGAAEVAGLLVVGAALAPLVEELAFRGVLQPLLVRATGAAAGIAITALVFAALHFEPLGLLTRTLIGASCGILAHRAGRLWPAVVLHGIFNGISLILVVLLDVDPDRAIDAPPASWLQPALVAAAVLVAALAALLHLVPVEPPPEAEPGP